MKHRLVILDWATMTANDDLTPAYFRPFATTIDAYPLTPPEQVAARIGDAALVLCNKTPITREVMEQCPNLRYVGLFATGYNNVDLAAATAHGITVCNAGSYSTNAVAQHVFANILEHYSRPALYHMDVRRGNWCSSPTFSYFPYPTAELSEKTLGIIGYGSIGKAVARIGAAFGMRPIIATRTTPVDCPYRLVSIAEAFAKSDVLTLHCPLTEQTASLVNAARLRTMQPHAILINTSRGGVVEEAALADALNTDALAAAYLDVLAIEPMAENTPLRDAKNCFITPHIAWAPRETRERLMLIVADNLRGFVDGKPKNQVN